MDVKFASSLNKIDTIASDPYLCEYIYIYIYLYETRCEIGPKERAAPHSCYKQSIRVKAFSNKSWQVTFEVPPNYQVLYGN